MNIAGKRLLNTCKHTNVPLPINRAPSIGAMPDLCADLTPAAHLIEVWRNPRNHKRRRQPWQ